MANGLSKSVRRREVQYGLDAWIEETLKLSHRVQKLPRGNQASNEDFKSLVILVIRTQQALRDNVAEVQALRRSLR